MTFITDIDRNIDGYVVTSINALPYKDGSYKRNFFYFLNFFFHRARAYYGNNSFNLKSITHIYMIIFLLHSFFILLCTWKNLTLKAVGNCFFHVLYRHCLVSEKKVILASKICNCNFLNVHARYNNRSFTYSSNSCRINFIYLSLLQCVRYGLLARAFPATSVDENAPTSVVRGNFVLAASTTCERDIRILV